MFRSARSTRKCSPICFTQIPALTRFCQKQPAGPEIMADETALASEHRGVGDYERRVAKDIVIMLLETRVDAERVLAYVDAMLNLPVGKPEGETPAQT